MWCQDISREGFYDLGKRIQVCIGAKSIAIGSHFFVLLRHFVKSPLDVMLMPRAFREKVYAKIILSDIFF